jgi:type IV pilus assembly protein PilX
MTRAFGSKQSGVVLFIALIVLIAMSLAGLSMMRSVTGGVLVAGNLAFKQAATSAGDLGLELGRQWLTQNASTLKSDRATDGYFASWEETFDPMTFDWSARAGPVANSTAGRIDPQGHDVRFVIHRMCDPVQRALDPDPIRCTMANGGALASSMRNAHYQDKALAGAAGVYYRITARVTGVRGTTSFVQAIVQM